MKHSESSVKVYQTKDYSIFQRIPGNRDMNKLKIKKMVRDIKHGLNFLPDFPILVSPGEYKMHVIDGQHRLEAASQTNQNVYYIIRIKEIEVDHIARINSLQEGWKPIDFINCFIEKGNNNYEKLHEFISTYKLPISVSILLLSSGITGNDSGLQTEIKENFRKGNFEVKHWKQAVEIIEECQRFSVFPGWNTRPFIVAISKILAADLCDFDELVSKVNDNPKDLQKQSNYKQYLKDLESIYNKGYHKRRTIF